MQELRKQVDKKRIGELDFLKGIAIICVVVGHVHLFSQPPGGAEDWTYRVIYSFHMPLFMTISGLLSASLFDRPVGRTVTARFRRLILPCLVWQLLTVLIVHTYGLWDIVNEYWYLKCLFFCTCLTAVMSRIVRSRRLCVVLCMAFTLLIPVVWNIPYMYPFFALGLFVGRRGVLPWLNRHATPCIIVCALMEVVLLRHWTGSMAMDFSHFYLFAYNATYWHDLYCFAYRIVIAVNSCVLLYCLSVRLLSRFGLGFVNGIGRSSLGIYLTHTIFLNKMMGISLGLPKPAAVLLFSMAVLALSLLVCRLISMDRRLAAVMLGE